eukprot:110364-Prymnesium_polylepis.1
MVVVVPPPGAPEGARPPLFCQLRRFGGTVATFCVVEYSWWTLGTTVLHYMPDGYQSFVGLQYPSLAGAAQAVHHMLFGTRTNYLRSLVVYFTGAFDLVIASTAIGQKVLADSPLARAHAHASLQSHPTAIGHGCWLE